MTGITEIAIGVFLLIGAAFMLVGSYGLLKLNDSMKRLHAPTKAGTMGVGALLVASMIHGFEIGEGTLHDLLILAFLFITAPISAHFIAKVGIHRRNCDTPPEPAVDSTWSTLDVPPNDTLAQKAPAEQ